MVKKSNAPSALQARVEQERQAYATYRDVLARRIGDGEQSPHVHRGLTRTSDADDVVDGSRAELAILAMLRQIQTEQQELRRELERQGALLDALSRRGL